LAALNRRLNFDGLAPVYRLLEYATFGPMLQRCRTALLPRLAPARHALILGDGNGRFLEQLLRAQPGLRCDSVDISPAMLARQHARLPDGGLAAGARFYQADLRRFTPPGASYDLVVSHFFLDCLNDAEVEALIACIRPRLTPDAAWLVSEFAVAPRGLWRWACRCLIRGLYLAFALLTGLETRRLPDYSAALRRHGFHLAAEQKLLGGLLRAQLWMLR
jgi:ubiquinone/menaquinone biosynthesis C-methylase UbiE